jgi:fatty acyl-CoA reductase
MLSARIENKYLLFDTVTSSMTEPFPGWVDNFNGPVGLLIAGGKGFIRITYGDPNVIEDYMPVDVCIKVMLIAAWQKGVIG